MAELKRRGWGWQGPDLARVRLRPGYVECQLSGILVRVVPSQWWVARIWPPHHWTVETLAGEWRWMGRLRYMETADGERCAVAVPQRDGVVVYYNRALVSQAVVVGSGFVGVDGWWRHQSGWAEVPTAQEAPCAAAESPPGGCSPNKAATTTLA